MYLVSLAGRRFSVSDAEIAAVRERLTDAVRSGGGFVTFTVRGQTVEVLVTPGVPVVVERVPDPEMDDSRELAAAGASRAESVVPTVDEFDDWGI